MKDQTAAQLAAEQRRVQISKFLDDWANNVDHARECRFTLEVATKDHLLEQIAEQSHEENRGPSVKPLGND